MSATRCVECGGTGFVIRTGQKGEGRAARCRCSYEDQGRMRFRAARIPRRYEMCTFDNFEVHDPSHRTALDAARAWSDRWPNVDGEGLLLVGPPGTGKTHLATSVLAELALGKNAHVLFWEQRELLKALQDTFGPDAPRRESSILGPVQSAEVLVLDDLGAGRTTEWARDVLHEVIAHRYNHRLPLILTTTCRVEDDQPDGPDVLGPLSLSARLGEALMSRLFEMCRILRIENFDYRKEVRNARITRH